MVEAFRRQIQEWGRSSNLIELVYFIGALMAPFFIFLTKLNSSRNIYITQCVKWREI